MNRRDVLRLSLIGGPLLFARCGRSVREELAAYADGRLHASVDDEDAPSVRPGTPTPKPTPLGIRKDRDGVFYAPQLKNARAPLLLFLHGAGGSGEWAIERLIEDANRTGTIIVAPDSRDRTWGMITGDELPDVAFIDATLQKMFDTYPIDPRRVLIGGFSDGASAALGVGLVNGDLFSGIAAFSPGFVHVSSEPQGTPKVFISHGTRDEILPVDRCGRRIARELKSAGYIVEYREFDGPHTVPPEIRAAGFQWLLAPDATRKP